MIKISAPWKETDESSAFVKVKLFISPDACERWVAYCQRKENKHFVQYLSDDYTEVTGKETILWYATDKKYADGICADRGDAFVVSLLHYAMATGSDIESEAPVSAALLYNIRTSLIPHLCQEKMGFRPIAIVAPITYEPCPSQNVAATGMSCGIDSFFTLWQHQQPDIPEDYRIKYLTFFNVGAINAIFKPGTSLEQRNQIMQEVSVVKAEQAHRIAQACGLELVFINSNISDYYRGMLVNSAHYRNCGAAMILQGLWNKYYYSSGGLDPSEVHFSLNDDPAYHEEMLLPWLSNETLRFYSTGHGYQRMEKTRILADYDMAQKNLNVCDHEQNCGECTKCKRTLSTLYALQKLDNFRDVFDLAKYKKHQTRDKLLIFARKKARFYRDIYAVANENKLYSLWEKCYMPVFSAFYALAKRNPLILAIHVKRTRKKIHSFKANS